MWFLCYFCSHELKWYVLDRKRRAYPLVPTHSDTVLWTVKIFLVLRNVCHAKVWYGVPLCIVMCYNIALQTRSQQLELFTSIWKCYSFLLRITIYNRRHPEKKGYNLKLSWSGYWISIITGHRNSKKIWNLILRVKAVSFRYLTSLYVI